MSLIDQNRETAFSDTIVAGDTTLLISIPWNATYASMVAMFDGGKNDKGVFCGGAANLLYRKNVETGLSKSFQYFYGLPGYVTHVLNVVDINGTWQLHDSYFNQYHVDFLGMLSALAAGQAAPASEGGNHLRRMVWHEACDEPSWPVVNPAICKGTVDFHASHYAADIVSTGWWPTLEPQFAVRNLPHIFASFACFPFAISGDQGYVTDMNSSAYWGVFSQIKAALGL
jgi:hypothetical protein